MMRTRIFTLLFSIVILTSFSAAQHEVNPDEGSILFEVPIDMGGNTITVGNGEISFDSETLVEDSGDLTWGNSPLATHDYVLNNGDGYDPNTDNQDLADVLSQGSVADRDINMDNYTLQNVGEITGSNIVGTANLKDNSVGLSQLKGESVGPGQLIGTANCNSNQYFYWNNTASVFQCVNDQTGGGGTTQDLSSVLAEGNVAGSEDIDMNGMKLLNVGGFNSTGEPIDSDDIGDGEVQQADIAANAVGTSELRNDSILREHFPKRTIYEYTGDSTTTSESPLCPFSTYNASVTRLNDPNGEGYTCWAEDLVGTTWRKYEVTRSTYSPFNDRYLPNKKPTKNININNFQLNNVEGLTGVDFIGGSWYDSSQFTTLAGDLRLREDALDGEKIGLPDHVLYAEDVSLHGDPYGGPKTFDCGTNVVGDVFLGMYTEPDTTNTQSLRRHFDLREVGCTYVEDWDGDPISVGASGSSTEAGTTLNSSGVSNYEACQAGEILSAIETRQLTGGSINGFRINCSTVNSDFGTATQMASASNINSIPIQQGRTRCPRNHVAVGIRWEEGLRDNTISGSSTIGDEDMVWDLELLCQEIDITSGDQGPDSTAPTISGFDPGDTSIIRALSTSPEQVEVLASDTQSGIQSYSWSTINSDITLTNSNQRTVTVAATPAATGAQQDFYFSLTVNVTDNEGNSNIVTIGLCNNVDAESGCQVNTEGGAQPGDK